MAHLTRRRFIGASGAVAAGLGLQFLPPSLKKVLAAGAPELRSLDQIEHVMILMQENRSFDHYFGSLSGVRGFDDPHALTLPNGRSVFHQPDAVNPDGYQLPFHLDSSTTSAAAVHDTNHAWGPQHASWNGGLMDSWLPVHRKVDGRYGPLTMGYYTREDLPFHYALADAFTICDGYHCSVFGPTHPNRLMAISGTIDPEGKNGGPAVNNSGPPFTWTTYPERLEAAGVTWRYYVGNTLGSDLSWFRQFQQAPRTSSLYVNGMQPRPPSAIADDIRNGTLPAVSWLNSQWLPSIGFPEASEHPSALPAAGAAYLYDVLEALGSRPDVWAKTVLFITWDENDGLFDHVVPPTPPPGTPGEYVTVNPLPPAAEGIAGPIGLGFRVPMLVVSPWTTGGWVCSDVFDHTSTLRFLERRFGVMESNLSAWRRATCGDLTSALRLGRPSEDRDEADGKVLAGLPDPAPRIILEAQQVATLPPPTAPVVQTVPHQEPGGNRFVALDVRAGRRWLSLGEQVTVTATLRNGGDEKDGNALKDGALHPRPADQATLAGVALALDVPPGWSAQATSATNFSELGPGEVARVTWRLTAPSQATAATGLVPTLTASYQIGQYQTAIENPVPVAVPIQLAAAFNNAGISNDSDQAAANFDGSGSSYSQQGLTAAGLAPGAAATSNGIQYVMPNVAAGKPDNVIAHNQTIAVPALPGATSLGLLGAASGRNAAGLVTIVYTDGSTQTASLGFSDWTLGGGGQSPAYGDGTVATMPYRNRARGGSQTIKTYVFSSAPIPLEAGKTVACVTLPPLVSGGQIHVFAIGTDKGPA